MVMTMISVTMMPIPIMCPTTMYVPPTRVISPIPRTMPCVPGIAPEPIVDYRSVYIHRFDDIVDAIDIFVTDNLYGHLVFLVFLYVYGRYILVDILCQNGL